MLISNGFLLSSPGEHLDSMLRAHEKKRRSEKSDNIVERCFMNFLRFRKRFNKLSLAAPWRQNILALTSQNVISNKDRFQSLMLLPDVPSAVCYCVSPI